MYWRAGIGRVLLWISTLTSWLAAIAAYSLAGSTHAAQALVLTGILLAPPVQEFIARFTHVRAPAKVAFYAVILLLPLAVFFITIDGFAVLDATAKKRGFASAAEMERAHVLKIATAEALAAHDEALRKGERDRVCGAGSQRLSAICFQPAHFTAAQAYANLQHDESEHETFVREAIGEQRKAFLAADRSCLPLLDRIDHDAVPALLAARGEVVDILAALWAQRLNRSELETVVARSKPGVSYIKTQEAGDLERKVKAVAPDVDGQLAAEIKRRAQRMVLVPMGWRALVGVKPSVGGCAMVEADLKE